MRLLGRFFVKNLTMAVSLLLTAGLMVSCDVHQFPEQIVEPEIPDDPVNPDDPTKYVELNMNLYYHTNLYLWEHYYDPKSAMVVEQYPEAAVDEDHPGTTQKFSGRLDQGFKNVEVKFYNSDFSEINRHEETRHSLQQGYDLSMPVMLMPGEYNIVAWSDLEGPQQEKRFYDTTHFHSVKIDYDVYEANTDFRDTFRGSQTVTLGENGGSVDIDLYRPMAKYEFVTTDLSEFLDKESERRGTRASIDDYDVRIYYSTYHPSAHNVVDDWLEDATTGVSFSTQVEITGESEASLGFDYVFINYINDAGVQATIVVYDREGNNVAQSQQITVPLRRDYHTLLRGAFLTMNGSGGVGIDPGFNGDHNVIQ